MNKLEKYRPCAAVAPATAKLLLLMLREITNEQDTIIIPQRRIAEALGVSRGTVSRNLRRLERVGILEIQTVYNQYNGRMPNKYILRKDAKKDGG
jgi:DNA-binding Lrp family transcriptional regulator